VLTAVDSFAVRYGAAVDRGFKKGAVMAAAPNLNILKALT